MASVIFLICSDVNSSPGTLPLAALAPGVYSLCLTTEVGTLVRKLVIE